MSPDVPHHRDAGTDDGARPVDGRATALDLHGVRPALLEESLGGVDGVLVGGLVGAERQVGDEERGGEAPPHGLGEREHFVDGDRNR